MTKSRIDCTQNHFLQKRINRLEAPFASDCVTFWNQTDLEKGSEKKFHLSFSMQNCQRFCIQREIREKCGCFLPSLVVLGEEDSWRGRPCYNQRHESSEENCLCQFCNKTSKKWPTNIF